MKLIMESWRQYEEQTLLLEGFEQALEEGKVGDWISANLDKLKSLINKFNEKIDDNIEPFIVAVDKWKSGKSLSEKEKQEFNSALRKAGLLFILPGGAAVPVAIIYKIIKHLVVNQMGGIAAT
jgi:formiminotetrahydrofolate cyclodeaminase